MLELPDLSIEKANEIVHSSTPGEILNYFDTTYAISQAQISQYQKNGFIKLEQVIEAQVIEHTRKVIGAAVLLQKEKDQRTLAEKSQYEQSFLQCGYLCWDYPAVKDFVLARRFAGIARDLMSVDGIRLWHDQALFKEPGGRITDMHQDTSYWPVDTRDTTTMWLALVDVSLERGCLYFLPGTHDSAEREYVDIFNNPHIPEQLKTVHRQDVPLKAGDVTFHNGLTFHGANPNNSQHTRQAMTVIYIADGTRFDATDERNRTHTSCEGLSDGDLIDTKYTPLLV